MGPIKVATDGRDDVTIVTVPRSCVGFITGHRGQNLRDIEVRRESIRRESILNIQIKLCSVATSVHTEKTEK